jgi:hypothetical protein
MYRVFKVSPGAEWRISWNLAVDEPSKQTGLNLEDSPISHLVSESRMSDHGVEASLIRADYSLPAGVCQSDSPGAANEIGAAHFTVVDGANDNRVRD